jgi:hypothetical protein
MSEQSEAPRRLRAADVIETLEGALAAALTRSSGEPYVSVEFTRNAKGETQISTKVSAPGGTDEDALGELAAITYREACAVYDEACAAYPTGSGFVRNEGQEARP